MFKLYQSIFIIFGNIQKKNKVITVFFFFNNLIFYNITFKLILLQTDLSPNI